MKFINYLNEGINDKGIFKAVFLAGNPGAGKTYTLSKIKSGSIKPKIVNTDNFFNLFSNDWDEWNKISKKVKILNINQFANYINSMLPLAIDGTSNNISNLLKRFGILELFGYDISMVFITTSLETSIKRAEKRERKVNIDFIKKIHNEVNKAKEFYHNKFKVFIEINNNEGELNNKVILKSFKQMNNFYNSPIQNPVGIKYKQKLIKSGDKYLSPNIISIEKIKQSLNGWY